MKLLSPIIRILCGLVLIIAAAVKYFSIRAQIAAGEGEEVQILGQTVTSETWQLGFAFGIACFVGILLIILGGISLMKGLQEA